MKASTVFQLLMPILQPPNLQFSGQWWEYLHPEVGDSSGTQSYTRSSSSGSSSSSGGGCSSDGPGLRMYHGAVLWEGEGGARMIVHGGRMR